ncbi:MAG: transporter substrate-binding domain-containing protein [Desulfobacter sp.]|nr:MAG: transporter substrate-binding domain-containing protein [Desulfobacter sp.]
MGTLKKFVLCLALLTMSGVHASAGEIVIAYIERPPFYYTENSSVKGILSDLTNEIFKTAGIPHSWQSLPPNRILSMFQYTDCAVCSPGWFFKADRLSFANFTLAIYQNTPLSVLVLKQAKSRFDKYESLTALFSDRSMTMGTVATYRYSGYIDQQIIRYHPRQIKVSSSAAQLIAMILKKRIDYIIIAPMEAESLINEAGLKQSLFDLLAFPDIPPGNKRYLMCNKSVDKATIDALNTAIRQLVKPEIWGE